MLPLTFRQLARGSAPALRRLKSSKAAPQTLRLPADFVLPSAVLPHFTQRVALSDGSTITTFTTSPRSTYKSTKDTANHALWNPTHERDSTEDESGRLGRFAKRFGLEGVGKEKEGTRKERLERALQQGGFAENDLGWLSRQATDMEVKVQAKVEPKMSKKDGKGKRK